jgi:hypothetical protein
LVLSVYPLLLFAAYLLAHFAVAQSEEFLPVLFFVVVMVP